MYTMKKVILIAGQLLLFVENVQTLGTDDKCRVLALRGGGTHGSFEVGVLKAFVEMQDPIEVQYDYVSGVSIGAINAAVFSLYEKGDEADAVKKMEHLYLTYPPTAFWSYWPFYFIETFWKKSFFDSTGLHDIIDEEIGSQPFNRGFSWQSVDLNSGKVVMFDETVPMDIRNKAVASSASLPSAFAPVNIDDYWLVDGGVFQNLALGDPIQRCRDEGVPDENIIVDIILCFSSIFEIIPWDLSETMWKDAFSFYSRKSSFNLYYEYYEDMVRMTRGYPHIQFRHIVAPTQQVPSSGFVPIFATMDDIKEEIRIGYEDGKKAVLQSQESEDNSNLEDLMQFVRIANDLHKDAFYESDQSEHQEM